MALCPISIPVQARAQAPLFSQRDKELARLVTGGIGSQEYWQFLVDLEQRRAGAPQKSWTPGMPLFSERGYWNLQSSQPAALDRSEYWKLLPFDPRASSARDTITLIASNDEFSHWLDRLT